MKVYKNGKYIEVDDFPTETPTLPYEQRVVNRIRERYTVDEEFAIHRQRYTKPEKFAEYNAFIEKVMEEEKGI